MTGGGAVELHLLTPGGREHIILAEPDIEQKPICLSFTCLADHFLKLALAFVYISVYLQATTSS